VEDKMKSKLIDESRDNHDKTLRRFQYIKDTALGAKIQVKLASSSGTEEVKLIRRGRQSVRVVREDGSEVLVNLADVVVV